MNILGIDPGTHESGWALIQTDGWNVVASGRNTYDILREMIIEWNHLNKIDGIAVESVIIYSLGKKKIDSNSIVPTILVIGRLQELAQHLCLSFATLDRPEVIFRLTGTRPGRNIKVTKTNMQDVVQQIMELEKPIRPQHANDAAAVVLATYHPDHRK